MAAVEPVNIQYILSYVERGLRRAVQDDRALRTSVLDTGAAIEDTSRKAVDSSVREQAASREKVRMYLAAARAAEEGSAAQVAAYNLAAEAATRAGTASEAAALRAQAAAAQSDEALAMQANSAVRAAVQQEATGRRVVESYLQIANAAERGSAVQRAAYAQAIAAAREYSIAVVGANDRAAASHEAAGAAAAAHGREERGALRGVGLFRGTGVGGLASGAFLGGFAVGEFAKGVVQASQTFQANSALLQRAVENQGVSWQRWGARIDSGMERLSRFSGFLRGDLLAGLAQMVRVTGGDVPQALKNEGVAADLARARHMDLSRATMIVARAQLGLVGPLARFGINIQKVTTAEDALRDSHAKVTAEVHRQAVEYDKHATGLSAINQLQKMVAGSSAAYMGTAAGALANYHRAIEDLQISLGRELMPVLGRVAQRLADWIDHLRETGKAQLYMHDTIETVRGVLSAVLPVVRLLTGALEPLVRLFGNIRGASEFIVSGLIARQMLRWAVAVRETRVAVALLGETEAMVAAREVAMAKGLVTLEAEEATAGSRLTPVLASLRNLAALGVITVGVEVLIHRQQVDSMLHGLQQRFVDFQRGAFGWLARGEAGVANAPGIKQGLSLFGVRNVTAASLLQPVGGSGVGIQYRGPSTMYQPPWLRGVNALTAPGGNAGAGIYQSYLHNQSYLAAAQPQAPFNPALIVRNVLQPARDAVQALQRQARSGAINAIIAQYIRDVNNGRDNFLRRAFAHEVLRMLPANQQDAARHAIQEAYVRAALASRGKVDADVWAARLAGLPPGVQAAVRAALAQQRQKADQHAIDAVLHAADRAQQSIGAMQGQAGAQISLSGMDPASAGAIGIQQAVDRTAIARLQQVQATLRAALTRTRPGMAKYNEIEQRLQDIGSQILQDTAAIADLAGQAIMAGLDQIANRVQQQNAAAQAGAGLTVARAGYASGSLAAVRVDQRLQQVLLGNLQSLAGAIASRLARARAGHHQAQVDQLTGQLADVNNQITAVLTQQADDVHAAADAIRAGRAQQRQRRLARAARLVGVAQFYEQLQEGRLQLLQNRQQLAGIAGTPAAGQAQAAFIRQNIIPALRREQVALRRDLRVQLREGDRAGARQTREQLQQVQVQIQQQQLAALQAIAANTGQTVDTLKGSLALTYRGQLGADIMTSATGAS